MAKTRRQTKKQDIDLERVTPPVAFDGSGNGVANNLKIIPIRPEEDEFNVAKELHPHLPDIWKGQLLCMVAPIRSSKSTTWNWLIHHDNAFNNLFGKNVTVISNTIASDSTSRFTYKKYKHGCYEQYNDKIITDLIKSQKEKLKECEQIRIPTDYALIIDDCFGQFSKAAGGRKGRAAINFSTRFRHYVKKPDGALVIFSTQKYKDLDTCVRNNATGMMISGNIRNDKEISNIVEDYADTFGGKESFLNMFQRVQAAPYQWLYLKLDTTPPTAFLNFEEQLF